MTDTMAREWRTVSEAASLLKVSTRTVQRMIKSGQLDSMMDENGRRLVDVSDSVTQDDNMSETLSIVGQQQERALQMANSMIAAASRRAEQVDEQVHQARKNTSRVLMVLGVLLVMSIAAAWQMASSMAQKEGQVVAAKTRISDLESRISEIQDQSKDLNEGQKANMSALATQLRDRAEEAARASQQRDKALQRLQKLQDEKVSIHNELSTSKFENTRLKGQIADLERRIAQLHEDLGTKPTAVTSKP